MNEEILNGISKLNVSYDDFEHNLEDNNYTYAYHTYIFETDNYMVTLELCETAVWESYDYYETNNLEIENLIVENQDGVVECTLTDEEILKLKKFTAFRILLLLHCFRYELNPIRFRHSISIFP